MQSITEKPLGESTSAKTGAEARLTALVEPAFVPHPALRNGHLQTLLAYATPRRLTRVTTNSTARIFGVAPGVKLLGYCSFQERPASHPTVLILHGLEGSSESQYMKGTAEKCLAAGCNVIRLNMRNCGGTGHLSSLIYHAGLTDDVREIVRQLIRDDGLPEIFIAGFSLGGNMALKLAGEYGTAPPPELRGIVAVSPSIDLAACADAIELKSNLIYHLSFIRSLRMTLRNKARLFPDRYDAALLNGVWTIRRFDDLYTAPHSGFRDSAEYYEKASAARFIPQITLPTLIIHAKDDPFIPFAPFQRADIESNRNVKLLATDRGGHVGFIADRAFFRRSFLGRVQDSTVCEQSQLDS